jgi:elongation factor 4
MALPLFLCRQRRALVPVLSTTRQLWTTRPTIRPRAFPAVRATGVVHVDQRIIRRTWRYSSTDTSRQDSNSDEQLRYSSTDTSRQDSNSDRQLVSILENEDLLEQIPLQDVRNFCFIAHIDHGKSSLSSRILELTGNLGKDAQQVAWSKVGAAVDAVERTTSKKSNMPASSKERIELLDTLSVEQQRGITVKASTASMLYRHHSAVGPTGVLLINMFDLPGHVDFGQEVSRSLHFVQGAVLLLDAAQGIQAQTWSAYEKAKNMACPPKLIVALTKLDLENARPVHVALTVSEWLQWDDPDSILLTSARDRRGVKELLDAICEQVPPPKAIPDDDGSVLRAVVVDSWYEPGGVHCLVQIASGTLREGDRISLLQTGEMTGGKSSSSLQSYSVQTVGLVLPKMQRAKLLRRGQMGKVLFGLRDPRQAIAGTVIVLSKHASQPMLLPENLPSTTAISKSVLYASVHPQEADGFEELCSAVDRLALNDTGLEVQKTASSGSGSESGGPFLGPGLRVGFQGLLHVEVFRQRLHDEFGMEAVVTPPKVPYVITFLPDKNNSKNKEQYTKVVEDLSEWPELGQRFQVLEPVVDARVIARGVEDTGAVLDLLTRKRATNIETTPLDEEKYLYTARIPWAEVVTDLHDQLKVRTTLSSYLSRLSLVSCPPPASSRHAPCTGVSSSSSSSVSPFLLKRR